MMGMMKEVDRTQDATAHEPLQWLSPWLELYTTFYEKKCAKHDHKYHTVFCTECMGDPICISCHQKERHHEGHKTLNVCRASYRAAVYVNEAKRWFDTSFIHVYTINDKGILHLVSSNAKEESKVVRNSTEHNCLECKTKIDQVYDFCSIACKMKSYGINGLRLDVDPKLKRKRNEESRDLQATPPWSPFKREEGREGMIILNSKIKRVQKKPKALIAPPPTAAAPVSLRKHRRKGIPIRAPLF